MLTRRGMIGGLAACVGVAGGIRSAAAMSTGAGEPFPERTAGSEAATARMPAALPYRRVTVPGAQAWSEYRRIAAAGDGCPVIVGDDAALELVAATYGLGDRSEMPPGQGFLDPPSPADLLAAAEALRAPERYLGWEGGYAPDEQVAPDGEWPPPSELEEVSILGPTVATDLLTGRPFPQVHILVLPAQASWEVPAWLRWGGWNACPPPQYHVAALRSWHERYGAELIGINGDTMNLRAERPPRTRSEAMALARELYRFCPDVVDQGVGTLSRLAAGLLASEWWYLWWD